MSSSKPFAPTPRRLRKLREEGKSVKSQLVNRGLLPILVCNIFVTVFTFPFLTPLKLLELLMSRGFTDPVSSFREAGKLFFLAVLCALTLCAFFGLTLEAIQSPRIFKPNLALPDLTRAGIVQGTKKIVGGLRELWLTFSKGAALFIVFIWFFTSQLPVLKGLIVLGGQAKASALGDLTGLLSQITLCAIAPLVICELLYRRFEFMRSAKMSRDELRREHRDEEGDPMLKQIRKGLHEALVMSSLVRAIRRSKVVVVERR